MITFLGAVQTPHSNRKSGLLGWTGDAGAQTEAPLRLTQETHDHSSWVISEECHEGTVYHGAGREQGCPQDVDFRVILGLETEGGETVLLLGLKEQGEEHLGIWRERGDSSCGLR